MLNTDERLLAEIAPLFDTPGRDLQSTITSCTRLRDDLGLSSLAVVQLLMQCEESLRIDLAQAPEELLDLHTVGDVLLLVRALRVSDERNGA